MSIVAKLNAAQTKAEAMEKERDEALGKVTQLEAAAGEAAKTHSQAVEQLTAEHTAALEAAYKERDEATAKATAAQAKLAELEGSVKTLEGERDGWKTKAELAHKALGAPQYVDAALQVFKDEVPDGGEGNGEPPPNNDERKSNTPTWDAYNALTDGATRTRFWNENESKLRDEQRNLAKKED